MRKALIIGINHYDHLPPLTGCVNDARSVASMLEEHDDATSNFLQPLLMVADDASTAISKSDIKNAARELFEDKSERGGRLDRDSVSGPIGGASARLGL